MVAAEEHLGYAKYLVGNFQQTHWDTTPIASTLFAAASGFNIHLLLGPILPGIIAEAKILMHNTSTGRRFKLQQFIERGIHSLYLY